MAIYTKVIIICRRGEPCTTDSSEHFIILYISPQRAFNTIFVFAENYRQCTCVMGNILIVTGPATLVYFAGPAGSVFLPEKPIVLPDIWLMSRDLQKRPAAYFCAYMCVCVCVCICRTRRPGEKQSVGTLYVCVCMCRDFRLCLIFIYRNICVHKERIETQLRAHYCSTNTVYVRTESYRADPKLIYLTEKRRDLSCIYTQTGEKK